MTDRVVVRVRVSEARCPFCHVEIPRGEEPVCCPGCHAQHHEACLREHPACAGCGAVHPRFAPAAQLAGTPQPRRRRRRMINVGDILAWLRSVRAIGVATWLRELWSEGGRDLAVAVVAGLLTIFGAFLVALAIVLALIGLS